MNAYRIVEPVGRAATVAVVLLLLLLPAFGARRVKAQSPLSLSDAIARATAHNPDAESAAAFELEAAERIRQARAAFLPRVDAAESWQRGNDPVFVFGALLAQRRFAAAGFAPADLNRPAPVDAFRAAVSITQSLFDRSTIAAVRAATIERQMAATRRQLVNQDLTAAVTDAFGRVLTANASVGSAASAVESARADRERAGQQRDAGRVTDADVLQLDVYLTRALERQVQAVSDERIARAQLNQLMGEPLTAVFQLDSTPPAAFVDLTAPEALEAEAVANRADVALARQMEQLAGAAADKARAMFLPQATAHGGWELNGGSWPSRVSSWIVGADVRINVFRGFADRARLSEARYEAARRASERRKAETMVRLDVRTAVARLEAARASEAVGRAAADSARASRQIVRDRYESGLADAAMLLRAADAVQQAEAQQIAAFVNVLTATASLQRAVGRQ